MHSVRERAAAPARRRIRRAALSEFDTLAELRSAIEDSYRGRLEELAVRASARACSASLGEAIEVDLPPYTIAGRVEELLGDLARNIERQGVPFGTFLRPDRPHDGAGHAGAAARGDRLAAPRARARGVRRARGGSSIDDAELESALREELADEEDVDAALQEVLASRAKEAARDELRLQRALDRACEIATPISAELQAAREQLWTPGDDEKTEPAVEKPTIWTPGQPR